MKASGRRSPAIYAERGRQVPGTGAVPGLTSASLSCARLIRFTAFQADDCSDWREADVGFRLGRGNGRAFWNSDVFGGGSGIDEAEGAR